VPALLIILFGYALTVDVKHVKVTIFDQDRSTVSRKLIHEFSHTEYIDIIKYAESYSTVDDEINSGRSAIAIVIPVNFESDIKTGKKTLEYKIYKKFIVEPDDFSILNYNKTDKICTLFTCHPVIIANKRLVVQGIQTN